MPTSGKTPATSGLRDGEEVRIEREMLNMLGDGPGLNHTKTTLDNMEYKAFTISSWNIQGLRSSAFDLKSRNQT